MAKFNIELPESIMRDIQRIENDAEKIFSGMVEAGAAVVRDNVAANAPIPEIASHLAVSKTYKTPSDGGINSKVYFRGYYAFRGNRTSVQIPAKGRYYTNKKGVPVGFVAMMYEYGSSNRYTENGSNRGVFKKKPFFRKSFNKSQIEAAMEKAQIELSGGLLEDE